MRLARPQNTLITPAPHDRGAHSGFVSCLAKARRTELVHNRHSVIDLKELKRTTHFTIATETIMYLTHTAEYAVQRCLRFARVESMGGIVSPGLRGLIDSANFASNSGGSCSSNARATGFTIRRIIVERCSLLVTDMTSKLHTLVGSVDLGAEDRRVDVENCSGPDSSQLHRH